MSTPTAPAPTRPISRALLWLPLPVIALVGVLLCVAHRAVIAGIDDKFLEELLYVFVVLGCIVIGTPVLAIAIVASLPTAEATRRTSTLINAVLTTTACLAGTAWCTVTYADRYYQTTSSTWGSQFGWQLAAAVVALVPLGAVLIARRVAT